MRIRNPTGIDHAGFAVDGDRDAICTGDRRGDFLQSAWSVELKPIDLGHPVSVLETELVEGANCCYELVMDGIDEGTVGQAMRVAIEAASGDGVLAIGAGNYGGKLGKFNFHLREVMGDS